MIIIRFELFTNFNGTDYFNSKQPIRFGLRESIKGIKSSNTRLVAISADLKPRYVVNRFILRGRAYNKQINILCLPNLDKLIQTLLGFSCFALIITENQSHEFDELFNWCHKVFIDSHGTSSLNESILSEQYFRKRNGSYNSYQNKNKVSNDDYGLNLHQIYVSSGDVIPGQRAFHPANSGHFKPLDLKITPINEIGSDFIQLNTFDATGSLPIDLNLRRNHEQHKKTKRNKYMEKLTDLYQPLTIHKIQPNPRKI